MGATAKGGGKRRADEITEDRAETSLQSGEEGHFHMSKGEVGSQERGGAVPWEVRIRAEQVKAKNKAVREKRRRETLNERYGELALLLEPGKFPRADKNSILELSIKTITKLKQENVELKRILNAQRMQSKTGTDVESFVDVRKWKYDNSCQPQYPGIPSDEVSKDFAVHTSTQPAQLWMEPANLDISLDGFLRPPAA
mmetsp:Transcript_14698/g.37199  ORF Transcript_14698/g.37199 Transcript_14698/m.37199 type:complete len:198 (-) Transcript_14698:164-757(-)